MRVDSFSTHTTGGISTSEDVPALDGTSPDGSNGKDLRQHSLTLDEFTYLETQTLCRLILQSLQFRSMLAMLFLQCAQLGMVGRKQFYRPTHGCLHRTVPTIQVRCRHRRALKILLRATEILTKKFDLTSIC